MAAREDRKRREALRDEERKKEIEAERKQQLQEVSLLSLDLSCC